MYYSVTFNNKTYLGTSIKELFENISKIDYMTSKHIATLSTKINTDKISYKKHNFAKFSDNVFDTEDLNDDEKEEIKKFCKEYRKMFITCTVKLYNKKNEELFVVEFSCGETIVNDKYKSFSDPALMTSNYILVEYESQITSTIQSFGVHGGDYILFSFSDKDKKIYEMILKSNGFFEADNETLLLDQQILKPCYFKLTEKMNEEINENQLWIVYRLSLVSIDAECL